MKRINNAIILLLCMVACTTMLFSCDSKKVNEGQNLVISEIMSRNRTGLLSPNQKASDWIEITNTSNDSINLEGFRLAVVKEDPDSGTDNKDQQENQDKKKKKDKKKKDKKKNEGQKNDSGDDNPGDEESADSGIATWEFPDFKIGGGESIIIFADKGKSADSTGHERTLSASLKLPKKGATIQLLSPRGEVIKEVKYGRLAPDQSLALQADSTYAPTYWQSPGFDNTREGYEKAMEKMSDQRRGPLLISEFMTREMHSGDNWVELKNYGDKEIELSDYSLSKKLGKNEEYWQLPSRKLQPGQTITIQLAGKNRNPFNPLQASIKAGSSETLVLSKDGKFVDGVCGKLSPVGGSIGRIEGRKGFFFFPAPTRNQENGNSGRRFIAEMPQFDKKPGVYSNDKQLTLRLKDKSRKVRYTLNGSRPDGSSPVVGDSVMITRGTVVRAYAEGDSVTLPSNVATATYLPGVKHDMAVMNITVRNSDLYDYNSGIYANGPGYAEPWPYIGANFWKKWTKPAHVEFFDGKEGFSTDCGLRIFGGFSRAEAKKSFRLKFRGGYGNSEVDYDFFDTGKSIAVKDLVIRSGSQDYNRCMIRDEFFTSLLKAESPTLLVQEYRPVALYINAEYFGLYYIREKIDKHFVARKLKVPSDSVNIIMSRGYREEGSTKDYDNLIRYVQTHDMTDKANYDYISRTVDLQGLIDYKLGEIYSGNIDVGNIRYVRSASEKGDRKWHFIFYDLDASWVGYKPSVDYYLSMGGSAAAGNVTPHNIVISRLLANKEFRAMFLERLSHHLSTTFSPQNANAVFDGLVAKIRPEMKANCERWPQLSYGQWEKNLGDFKKKFADKPKIILNDMRSYLHITPEENKKYFSKLGY